ncbi:hypothetical protein TWF718_007704 [Orbilia javanica]|uniref:Uncharacterized protein n=1 Tax=Orbilia javanica TaxID=47235 RepID=A0AAN8MNN0_9PEZI
MGFSIKPPEPKMADNKIRKFNIVKDMKQSVSTSKNVPQLPPGLPGDRPARKEWTPKESTIAAVKKTWLNGKYDPKKVVDLWAAIMKFCADKKPLTGARPMELLGRCEQMVPAAPAIPVGSS